MTKFIGHLFFFVFARGALAWEQKGLCRFVSGRIKTDKRKSRLVTACV